MPTISRGGFVTRSYNAAVALATDNIEIQAQQHYQVGRYSEAAILWQQAAKTDSNPFNQAINLNHLANAYQELGKLPEAQKAIADSLSVLSKETKDNHQKAILAQSLTTRGRIELATGKSQEALETWKQATAKYREIGDEAGVIGNQINQAIALQSLGYFSEATEILVQVEQRLQAQPDSELKIRGLRNLGRVMELAGDLPIAQRILEQSLAISQEIGAIEGLDITLVNLGNIARNLRQEDEALARYQEAIALTNSNLIKAQAKLNQLRLLVENQQWEQASQLRPEIRSHLERLPPSRSTVYARVNFADILMELDSQSSSEIAQILDLAIQQAREIEDTKAEAFALTQLGELYEQSGQWQDARKPTELALRIAESINAREIVAEAQGQLGRLLKHLGNIEGAIASYTEAFNILESLRADLLTMNPNVQFDFRDNVEPVYRELVSLLLLPDNLSQKNLQRAREVIEALQLAEIENFLRDTCLTEKRPEPVQLEKIDPQAAIIYPIILSDRTEVILSLNGRLQRHTINLPQTEIESVLIQLYASFNASVFIPEYQKIARQVYNWLIAPIETQLAENDIKTLVFIPDGFLRNLPMGALYDGQHYLLENYAIATSPGLQLLPNKPLEIEGRQIETLMAGVSQERPGFSALPGVARELRQLNKTITGAKVLLDEQFTKLAFIEAIDSAPLDLIHIATHGQFSPNLEETFLLTWDGKINIKELGDTLERHQLNNNKPLELLVLSACQTASGDDRSLLGLAGLALRSGAVSTVGTLWIANDASTARLMVDFYQKIANNPEQTKAESLRQAQLNLIKQRKYKHPFYWAPFTLVGNWL